MVPTLRQHRLIATLLLAAASSVQAQTPPKPPQPIPLHDVSPPPRQVSIALLGDLSPLGTDSVRTLQTALREINLLRPAAVFTVGGLIPGMTRSTQRYTEEVASLQETLSALKMPWFPCVGRSEVISGTRDSNDHALEKAYEQSIGPLYYSRDVGALHVIVLDSEEGCGEGADLSETQLAWLKADLKKTFLVAQSGLKRTKWVMVLVHRPLWRLAEKNAAPASNWDRVHRMLLDFNERPIVSVEGGPVVEGPQVAGVWAGAERAYCKEPTRDGIRYTVVGATSARLDQDPANAVRHFTLLTFDEADGQVHPMLVALGHASESGDQILPDDLVTERERQVLDGITHLPPTALGLVGPIVLPPPVGATTEPSRRLATQVAQAIDPVSIGHMVPPPPPPVSMNIANPLAVPLEVQVRLASSAQLHWEMELPHQIRHLAPGAVERWPAEFQWNGPAADVKPPVVEFVVHWADPREAAGAQGTDGRVREVVLRRRVPVVRSFAVPVVDEVSMAGETGWGDAAGGSLCEWRDLTEEPAIERPPEWEMTADKERVFVRVRVEDGVKSYWPTMKVESRWGGLASDAVSIAWTRDKGTLERLWVLPFGPKGPELWEGSGADGLLLRRVDEKRAALVTMNVEQRADGYAVTLALPRSWMQSQAGGSGRVAIAVSNNDEGAMTVEQSSAPMDDVPSWGILEWMTPAPATGPTTTQDSRVK